MSNKKVRHILSLSGGKDSTALAIYMRDKLPDVEYVFCDTGEELPETYEYLERLEVFLGKSIISLNPDRPFTHYLEIYRGVLPDARTRWCTRMLKIKPFEAFVGDHHVVSYIAIRADEAHRKGYISTKPNIMPRYPFIEDGIKKEEVYRILEDGGLGPPKYYSWRSRSGCYFCFFQQRIEWCGLLENHPDLFRKAMQFEKTDPLTGEKFTWNSEESLLEFSTPERIAQVKQQYAMRLAKQQPNKRNTSLFELFDEQPSIPCLICTL
jgi:hypothetical protein